MRHRSRRALLLAALLTLAGCGLLPSAGPVVRLENMTNIPAAVYVNGGWVGTYAAGAAVDVRLGGRGAPPYAVSIHSPSGAELIRFDVTADDIQAAADGTGAMSGANLPCGRIQVSIGPTAEEPPVPFVGGAVCP